MLNLYLRWPVCQLIRYISVLAPMPDTKIWSSQPIFSKGTGLIVSHVRWLPLPVRLFTKKLWKAGLIRIFLDAGCTVNAPGCGACIGRHGGILAPGERAFTTMNRNFIGRMGSPEAEIFLGSPAAAAAAAITGQITDPRNYME